jgi:hypothetical protein
VAWSLDQDFKIDVMDLDAAAPHIIEKIERLAEDV